MLYGLARVLVVVDDAPEDLVYIGGVYTAESVRAVQSLLQASSRPLKAFILSVVDESCQGKHAVLIDTNRKSYVVRGGLTSGYCGEGPRGLSWIIELLEEFECYPQDVAVSPALLDRAQNYQLRESDLSSIRDAESHSATLAYCIPCREDRLSVWDGCSTPLPLALLDRRLLPIAVSFSEDADRALFEGYRRLEHILRSRLRGLRSEAVGSRERLAVLAFSGKTPALYWPNLDEAEATNRFKLFDASFSLFRNPRAHNEGVSLDHAFEQFMILNLLFKYEAGAVETP